MHPLFASGGGEPEAKRARSSQQPSSARTRVLRFTNCRVLREGELRQEDLWVQGGVIVSAQKLFWARRETAADATIDCEGNILAPGFIDLQLNGGFGFDFSTASDLPHGLTKVAGGVLKYGCTAFMPTVITSSTESYRAILPHLNPRHGSASGAAVLGVHLEGPFISPQKPGCHPPHCVRAPDGGPNELRRTYGEHIAHVKLVTLAPELPRATALIKQLVGSGIVVSAGHSMATTMQMGQAMRDGVSMVTHMFNAMPAFHQREPGIIGILGSPQGTPFFGMIADGVHVHPASLKIAARARPEHVVLVTDAMAAMGLADGTYPLAGFEVVVKGDRACKAGSDTLAGAVVPIDECVRRYRRFCGVGTVAALEAATLHPAQVMGIEHTKGALVPGADADLVLLDDELAVRRVYLGGELAFDGSNAAAGAGGGAS